MEPEVGRSAVRRSTVHDADTAVALGSGDVPVLATPRLLAWLEGATVAALEGALDEGSTSVGTRVEVEHTAPTPVGVEVEVTATLAHVDGRLLRFEVAATQPGEGGARVLVASGRVTRVVVDRDRFLARLAPRSGA